MGETREIRIGMVGMVDGNGHPYSWSAILNGFDPEAMRGCPYPVIPQYLSLAPPEQLGSAGARVTHIWTEDIEQTRRVAAAARIPCVAGSPQEILGEVDAVIIPTDLGCQHVSRMRPFVEAGLPILVDKPLVDNERDLQTVCRWVQAGAPIFSSSCMRYAKEYMPFRASTADLGRLRLVTITSGKSWERYGIHTLEAVYPILGGGFLSARQVGAGERSLVLYRHQSEVDVMAVTIPDLLGGFGVLSLYGTVQTAVSRYADNFFAFRAQLLDFIQFVRSGRRPFPFPETVELMKMLIAAIRSREEGGRTVELSEIREGSG